MQEHKQEQKRLLQDCYDRILVATDVCLSAAKRFSEEENSRYPLEPDQAGNFPRQPLDTAATRCTILLLSVKQILIAASNEVDLNIIKTERSVNATEDLPTGFDEAVELAGRFVSDAEETFTDFVRIMSYRIHLFENNFWQCVANLFRELDPKDEYWSLVTQTLKRHDRYKYTILSKNVDEAARVLECLNDMEAQLSGAMMTELNARGWRKDALKRLYAMGSEIRARKPPTTSPTWRAERDIHEEKTLGQAVALIWEYDENYEDTRSWFPPEHPWWPFYLPGKPRIKREHALPPTSVANVLNPHWGYGAIVVATMNGEVLVFNWTQAEPIATFSTGMQVTSIQHASFGIMLHGKEYPVRDNTPLRRYLILNPRNMDLEGKVLTERVPTDDELAEVEKLSRWRRDRALKKLSRCSTPIRQGLVAPLSHPMSFTLGQISAAHKDGEFVFWDDAASHVLKRATFRSDGSFRWTEASKAHDHYVGYDPSRSRIWVYNNETQHSHSFLSAPNLTHLEFSTMGNELAVAGPGHLYIYG